MVLHVVHPAALPLFSTGRPSSTEAFASIALSAFDHLSVLRDQALPTTQEARHTRSHTENPHEHHRHCFAKKTPAT